MLPGLKLALLKFPFGGDRPHRVFQIEVDRPIVNLKKSDTYSKDTFQGMMYLKFQEAKDYILYI